MGLFMFLVAENLRFGFAGQAIIDYVQLRVRLGESLAIVGPSGSGKSTLLALLGGLLRPQAGRVLVQDDKGDMVRPPSESVSWILQTVNVLADRSACDNVALGGYADGLSCAEARGPALRALDQVGLVDRAEDPLRVMSGGEVQRVVIARALMSARPFVLADEPTGQLDSQNTETVMDALVGALSTRGVIVVTHDPYVASRCDREMKLESGRLIERVRR